MNPCVCMCVCIHWVCAAITDSKFWNSKSAEMGRKAGSGPGKFGCLVKMPSHLAVPGTNL